MINLTKPEINKQKPKHKQPIETLLFIPGIWVNGKYLWLQNSKEKVIYDEEIIISVKLEQPHSKICFSSIYVSNHSNQTKEIKVLAMHHYSSVRHDSITFVSPKDNRIFHHANKQVFLVNLHCKGSVMAEFTALPQWSVYTDQIWSSLQKGILKYQPMAKGPAASISAIKISIGPHESCKLNTWTITGSNKNELILMEQALLKNKDCC
jgi:GH15 family glucan-1,4-alpha-glucosidase